MTNSLDVLVVVLDRKALVERRFAEIEADRQVLGLQTKMGHVTFW